VVVGSLTHLHLSAIFSMEMHLDQPAASDSDLLILRAATCRAGHAGHIREAGFQTSTPWNPTRPSRPLALRGLAVAHVVLGSVLD
jgi:hypothetical protein